MNCTPPDHHPVPVPYQLGSASISLDDLVLVPSANPVNEMDLSLDTDLRRGSDTKTVSLSGQMTADLDFQYCTDADLLSQAIAAGSTDLTFDANGDNVVDASDFESWVVDLKGTLAGDANLDLVVDGTDSSPGMRTS